jgi:integration host factor subunit alpha
MEVSKRTITRIELTEAIRREAGLSRHKASALLESFIDEVSEILVSNGRFLCTNFGTFIVQHKKTRMARNPNTGAPAVVTARNVVTFKASNKLKKRVSKTDAD